MEKQLLPDSTDFTEAIFKMPQISIHFSAMLPPQTVPLSSVSES